jgi:hypothetical protein
VQRNPAHTPSPAAGDPALAVSCWPHRPHDVAVASSGRSRNTGKSPPQQLRDKYTIKAPDRRALQPVAALWDSILKPLPGAVRDRRCDDIVRVSRARPQRAAPSVRAAPRLAQPRRRSSFATTPETTTALVGEHRLDVFAWRGRRSAPERAASRSSSRRDAVGNPRVVVAVLWAAGCNLVFAKGE